ncbi:MAG TPA: flagellin [Candidatus Glassbacteria bacterium]|nr:flagellin [Candidatus Glassbacteria bacterium]
MALSLNTNISAITARRNLLRVSDQMKTSMEKLSSGLRINRSADDAAGLTIAENLRAQIIGLNRAITNAEDGISLIQTGEGAMGEGDAILHRIRQLSVQAANGTLTSKDRQAIQNEVSLLIDEINRIARTTTFNSINLLNGNSSALVSTSNPQDVNGIVIGDVGQGGIFSITINVSETSGGTRLFGRNQLIGTGIFTTIDERGRIYDATENTTLQSISAFKNYKVFDGGVRSISLTLSSDADSQITEIELFATDSLDTVKSRVSLAINDPNQTTDLNLGGGISDGAPLVQISSVGESLGGGQVGSTIMTIMNPEPGRRLVWGGDDKAISAFGFQEIQEAQPPVFSITVNNISTPFQKFVPKSLKVFGDRAAGLIQGVDINFRPTLNISLSGSSLTDVGSFSIPELVVSQNVEKTNFLLEVTPRPLIFQIGANQGDVLTTRIGDISSSSLGISGINIVDQTLAGESIRTVDEALKRLNAERANLGAVQNRLESTIRSIQIASENLTSSESQIRDLDFSAEIVNFTALQVLSQSATSFLAQANALSNTVLTLIGG